MNPHKIMIVIKKMKIKYNPNLIDESIKIRILGRKYKKNKQNKIRK